MGAPEWDIADLCDHYNKGMTHYYTQAALENRDADTINRLIQTANLVCQPRGELRKVRQA